MSDKSPIAACPFLDPEHIFEDLGVIRQAPGLPYSDVYEARMVTRYDEITAALHDPITFSSSITVGQAPSPWREQFEGRVPAKGTLLGVDNPDHDRLRRSVNTFFMPRRLEKYEPWIREQAHRLVDTFVEEGQTELKTSFALPLPLAVISHVVGLDSRRSEWVGAALSFFMGPRDIHHAGTPDEKAALLLELHDYLLEVMAERKKNRRDDLISHIWNQRDEGTIEMTDFEMLSMFPGLMLAGHETPSNLICMALSHLLADPDKYAEAQRSDASRSAALEELFRFESAITGMKRLVMNDTVLGGVQLRAGEHVFLAYASGSRDAGKFSHADELDFDRTWAVPHLGFGQGIHACLGAPLARLLLRVELGVLDERLPGLRLGVAPSELHHGAVSEGRGIVSLPIEWTPTRVKPRSTTAAAATIPGQTIDVTVAARRLLTEEVVELTLTLDTGDVPHWAPGAHIDLELPDGSLRQYSLVGRPSTAELRVAVLRDDTGRGGSIAIHDQVAVAQKLRIRPPRNHFALRPASFYLFVAGGIGITPMLAMIDEAEKSGADWRLLYLGRSRDKMAYLDDLVSTSKSQVYAWPSNERGRYNLDDIWSRLPQANSYVYGCGPEELLSALENSARAHGREGSLIVERFAPRHVEHEPNRPITVELVRTGRIVEVGADESILDAINGVGAAILSTCREGTCGTCEVRVLAGIPEHRDSVLSLDERLVSDSMMTCVSRCRGSRLVLDV